MKATTEFLQVNDLRRGWIATDPEVRGAVGRVLAGGWYIKGPEHDSFESELAAHLGIAHAAAVANGTDALVLALRAIGCSAGSEVVTVANAGGYASNAAAQIGCSVVYADVDPETLLMTVETLEAAIGSSTKAVVLTHLYGNLADVPAIAAFCHDRGIPMVEDCAQAISGDLGGRKVGTFGDVAAFSFYPTKNLGAAGDGGAIATNDDEINAQVRALRQYGWTAKYTVTEAGGRNSRLDEVQAAILRIGLRRVDGLNARRREIVQRYAAAVQGPGVRLVTGAGCETVAHLAVIRAPDRTRTRAVFHELAIGSDIHYPIPDHRQPGLRKPVRHTALLETERAAEEILTLPCFPEMTHDEVDRVCAAIGLASSA